jgi:hypothetical protein
MPRGLPPNWMLLLPRKRLFLAGNDPLESQVGGEPGGGMGDTTGSDSDSGSNAGLFLTVVSGGTPPSITTQPTNETIVLPTTPTVTFSLVAAGDPVLTYQWTGFTEGVLVDNANFSGVTTPNLVITPTNGTWSGRQYFCVVTNPFGSATSNIVTFTVHQIPIVTGPAAFTEFAIVGGNPFTIGPITVQAGTSTPFGFTWQVSQDGGVTWTSAAAAGFDVTTPSSECKNDGFSLTFPPLSYDGMLIRCTVANAFGSSFSPLYTLEVRNPVTATAGVYAVAVDGNFSSASGGTNTQTTAPLSGVAAGGYSPYTYHWAPTSSGSGGNATPTTPTNPGTAFAVTDAGFSPGDNFILSPSFWSLTVTDSKGNIGGAMFAVGASFSYDAFVFATSSAAFFSGTGAHGTTVTTNASTVVPAVGNWAASSRINEITATPPPAVTQTLRAAVNGGGSAQPGVAPGFGIGGDNVTVVTPLIPAWIIFT